ncbi:MAG TPA: universal stress protein [Devosia sp.]|nr:universal stress protein [Devosia sp.]
MTKAILLPIDISNTASSQKALSEAIELSRSRGADLHVLTVVPDYGMALVGSFFPRDYSDKATQEVSGVLDAYVKEQVPDGISVHQHVRAGTIYKEIVAAANEIGADLIVLASHRPEMQDYLLGPNAARVVRHARQSVFVVRD